MWFVTDMNEKSVPTAELRMMRLRWMFGIFCLGNDKERFAAWYDSYNATL